MESVGWCLFELFLNIFSYLFVEYLLRGIWIVILLIFGTPYFMLKALFYPGPWWTTYKTINVDAIKRALPTDEQREALAAKRQLRQSRNNLNTQLQHILCDGDVRLELSYRTAMPQRIVLSRGDCVVIPGLDHLSAGQSILFNLFTTVIRYADKNNINSRNDLSLITGIIVIDEIDAHIHSDLQHDVLPKLIALFPNVQFILSSHSPLFLLGMEKQFGTDGISIIDIPTGNHIGTERFSEFQKSMTYYRDTKTFEEELANEIGSSEVPVVFTEGETDVLYLNAAIELLDRQTLKGKIKIEWIGSKRAGANGPFNTGSSALDHAKDFIEANPDYSNGRKTMLLYDWDTKCTPGDFGNLYVRQIPKNDANADVKGIENLLPISLLEDHFYHKKEIPNGAGRTNTIFELKKNDLSNWICEVRKDPADFVKFDDVIAMLDELVVSTNTVNI